MNEYASFRQRLDTVLRTEDVQQVADFLIAEGQWDVGAPVDPAFAMWMMIAGSPTLSDLHEKARGWLITHGHEAEAQALLERSKRGGGKPKSSGSGNTKGGKRSAGQPQRRKQ